MNDTHAVPAGTRDALPCSCGKGSLVVEVTTFGTWQVVTLLEACTACGSTDLHRKTQAPPLELAHAAS